MLDARPSDGAPPEALVRRGWDGFLIALDDPQLAAIEIEGLASDFASAPPSFVSMVEDARAVCAIDAFVVSPIDRSLRRREKPRKRAQVQAFSELVLPLAARAKRIVDVGSGHGHLTRDLALRLPLPVVGLERNRALATRAEALSDAASFSVTDVLEDGLPISADDCVVGLHVCGELGDAIVERAAERGASLVVVGCCLQKRRAEVRLPLGDAPDGLALSKRVLGLSNLTARDVGVEASREENVAARERRLALHRLLVARVGPFRFGAEIDGLNRRVAHLDLGSLVQRAFARRGLPLPSPGEIEDAAAWARVHHARARRLSLPRALLARAIEVFVLLDRARYLERRGFDVEVGTVFPQDVSARNLALVAAIR